MIIDFDYLKNETVIINKYIEKFVFEEYYNDKVCIKNIIIENCFIENIVLSGNINSHILISGCVINNISPEGTWFLGGLHIKQSVFLKYLNYHSGGHNSIDKLIIIEGNVFNDFANFFDCWFTGSFILKKNIFVRGSNILGFQNKPTSVRFDLPPLIEDNLGTLDYDFERI